MIDRRTLIASASALAASPAWAKLTREAAPRAFPKGFLWGASTAGHQVEGNNVNADSWVIENVRPTIYVEPSGDACNSLELWRTDLDLVKAMGLNAYRFSLEWPRIEPEDGQFSIAMLDHYKAMIAGCRERGLVPVVTFNHYTTPRWFAARGGWTNPEAPARFARFCDRAARHLAAGIGQALTLNEPNILSVLKIVLPPAAVAGQVAMLDAAARSMGVAKFSAGNAIDMADLDVVTTHLIAGHKAGRAAIKAVRGDLPVGLSLSMFDDQAAGEGSIRDAKRQELYGRWLDVVKPDDFLGVQNYERQVWGPAGRLPVPADAQHNAVGGEVYAPSLGNAVRYAHGATGLPIFVTEHGVNTAEDTVRAAFIPAALRGLRQAMDEGVPVIGYMHWSLIDNFEWIFGYHGQLGLHSFDPVTFARTPKPSAHVLGAIARANAV